MRKLQYIGLKITINNNKWFYMLFKNIKLEKGIKSMQERNVFDILEERGYVEQTIDKENLVKLLGKEKIPFYIGIDPTADSLHVGHFVSLMVSSYMQKSGHKPIILVGGGTATIGDPSGKTDMRRMMSREEIDHNVECFKKQISKFLSFEGENAAIIVNNADWLLDLKFINFVPCIRMQRQESRN